MTPDDNKPKEWREWWAYFQDYQILTNGWIHAEMAKGMSNNGAEIKVIERAALTAAEAEIARLKSYQSVRKAPPNEHSTKILTDRSELLNKLTAAEREIARLFQENIECSVGWERKVDELSKENAELAKEIEQINQEGSAHLIALTKQNEEQAKEIARLKLSRYKEGFASASMDREEAIFSERKACAERDKANEIIALLEGAANSILHECNMATQGHWNATDIAKNLAYNALTKLSEIRK